MELSSITLTRNARRNMLANSNHHPCDVITMKSIPTKLPPLNYSDHHDGENDTVEVRCINRETEACQFQPKAPDQLSAKGSHTTLDYDHCALSRISLHKDNSKLAKSTKMHLWRHLFLFLSTTSFHGLPFFAGSRRSYRLYWIILFLVALVLTVLSTLLVASHYAEMNKVLYSRLHFNKRLPFPAITICNLNFNRKSVFSSFDINLDDLAIFFNFIYGNPYLEEDFNFDEFYENYGYLFEAENSIFYYNNSGHQIQEMLYNCMFAGMECSSENFTQISTTNGNCYVFNSGRNQSILYSDDSGYYSGLELILSAEEYEYFAAESDSVGFNIFIDDQDHFPYISGVGGFSVSAGQLTQVILSKVDYKLLSSGGECSEGFNLKYFKSYSRLSCLAECFTDITVGICKCKAHYMPGPADVCKFTNPCWYTNVTYNEEQCNCPFPCEFSTYEKRLSYAKFPARHFTSLLNRSHLISTVPFPEFVVSTTEDNVPYLNDNFTESFLTNNYAKIRIYYDNLVSTTMEEHLEYSTSQFVIDFAGYVEWFTGAGFITFFEVMDLFFC